MCSSDLFWSKSPLDPYRPSVLVMTELIDPVSRKILYSDTFALGMDITSLQVMKFLYGEINMLPAPRRSKSFKFFSTLVKNPRDSRNALLKTVAAAARHVAKGLNGEKRFIAKTYAQTAAQVKIATTDDMIVNVYNARTRKSPSLTSKIIHRLRKGDVVTRMQKQGEWFYVRMKDGKTAWAHHSIFLKINDKL